ncbi:MAG: hypothetical protein V1902_01440 [Candidatus Falkowbacteria bacterium]
MAGVIELRMRKPTRAANAQAVAPEEIVYLEFRGSEKKQIRFATGSLRAKLFDDLERMIAEKTPTGQLLKFLRDKADIHLEFLLWLVCWLDYIDATTINQAAVNELVQSLRWDPGKKIKELAKAEEAIWNQRLTRQQLKKQGAPGIDEVKDKCRKSFNTTMKSRAAVFERLWRLMLVILSAYRQSVAPQRLSLWQRGRLFFLRMFAPTKWAREIS